MNSAGYIEPMSPGGSSRSHLSSRNPYRDPDDNDSTTSRNPYWSSVESRSVSMPSIPRRKPLPPSREHSYGNSSVPSNSQEDDIYSASSLPFPFPAPPAPGPPPLPARPGAAPLQRPGLPPRPRTFDDFPSFRDRASASGTAAAGAAQRSTTTFTTTAPPPTLPSRPQQQQDNHFFAFRRRLSQMSNGNGQVMQLPPRRLLTTDDVPVNSVGYTRNPEKVVAYLIPLPTPMYKGRPMKVPHRYVIYTPPAPHLLKPQGKEGKRHKVQRLAQQEVKKAKTFSGKTLSFRGLHSKALRGVDWAVAAVKNADITFLNRVPRRDVAELVLIHPASVLETESPEDVHREFTRQLTRTRRKAAQHSVVSTALFAPAIVIDTLAAVIWPFGGLAEIDGVWMYASVSGYLTARSVSKRLDQTPVTTAGAGEQTRLARELRGEEVGEEEDGSSSQPALIDYDDSDLSMAQQQQQRRRGTRQVRFQEELDEEDEKMKARDAAKRGEKKKVVKVRFVPDDAMDTMTKYFQEICHKRNPKSFPSSGVPPTKTDVLASIGWAPEKRARAPGQENSEGVWEDENWQNRQVKEDMDKVMMKAAKSWDKWCKSYAKYPERAMKEKGHSRVSEVMRRLHLKKDGPTILV